MDGIGRLSLQADAVMIRFGTPRVVETSCDGLGVAAFHLVILIFDFIQYTEVRQASANALS